MKFHRVEIENINSLYGSQKIDLDRDFEGVPVYLIMGPTGSGKTTILDAICLALFGSTPRQTRAAGGVSGVADLMNSHGTWYSRAVVEFSLLDPEKRTRTYYEATWHFERAYKKPDGNAKTPRRQLKIRRPDGTWDKNPLVASRKEKDYAPVFDQVLDGMKLEDFLRSVMLAQGAFAALLSAKAEEKAAILERITDTSAYQRMGELAYERMKKEEGLLKALETKIGDVDDVSEEAVALARTRFSQAEEVAKKLEQCHVAVDTRYDWLKRDVELDRAAQRGAEALAAAELERQARLDDLARVELHEQAQPAAQALRDLARYQREQAHNVEQLPALLEALSQEKARLEAARAEEAKALANLKEADDAYRAQAPQIQAAKDAQSAKNTAQEQAHAATRAAHAAQEKLSAANAQVEDAEGAQKEAQKTHQQLVARADEIRDDQAITAKWPFLQADFKNLEDVGSKKESQRDKLEELRAALDAETIALTTLDTKVQAKKDEVEPLEKAVDGAQNLLEELLGDADLPRERRAEIDGEINGFQARRTQLQDLLERVEERRKKARDRQAVEASYLAEKKGVLELQGRLGALQKEREYSLEKLAELDIERTRIQQGLWANKLRQELRHGQDCPVCGSLEHPKKLAHAEDAPSAQEAADLQQMQVIEAERDQLRAQDAECLAEIGDLTRDMDARARAEAGAQALLAAADDALTSLDARISVLAEDIGIKADIAQAEAEKFEREYEIFSKQLLQNIADRNAQKAQLDQAEDGVEAAKNAFERLHKDLQALEQNQRDAQGRVELARKSLATLGEELQKTDAQAESIGAALCAQFLEIGVAIGRDAQGHYEFGAGFEQARARRDAWDKNKAELDAATEVMRQADARLNERRVEQKSALERLQEKQAEAQEARKKFDLCARVLADCLAPFGEQTLAQVEAFHKAAIDAAHALKDASAEARQRAELSVKDAQNAHDHCERALAKLAEDMQQTGEKLDALLVAIAAENPGLSSVEALRAALLEDDEFGQLKALETRIQRALREAKNEVERVAGERARHGAERPEDFEAARYSLDILASARAQLKQAVIEQHTRLGELKSAAQYLANKMRDLLEFRRQRDAQMLQFEGWKELNELIGTSSGKRFKEFAQALHLDRIVARANHHLGALRPRYSLRTRLDAQSNLPTLDFEIVDREAAHASRPLSTLSGGETFLVSLALALALADQQQIRVPMETLFLDEGFGTLDRESLQQAMETLQHLHASVGRTVVVISHVEALKDKIAHQIVVTPELAGRSKIRVLKPA